MKKARESHYILTTGIWNSLCAYTTCKYKRASVYMYLVIIMPCLCCTSMLAIVLCCVELCHVCVWDSKHTLAH